MNALLKTLVKLSFALIILTTAGNAFAPNVTLAWDQSSDTTVEGYKIYWGNSTRIYTNNVMVTNRTTTIVIVSNLVSGIPYFFAATCYATNGLESDYSNEVGYTPPPKLRFPARIYLKTK